MTPPRRLPGRDPRYLQQITVHMTDVFPMIRKDFPPYHDWPHFPATEVHP